MPKPPIEDLHHDVERLTRHLHVLHTERLQCREGCSACCVDDLTVFEVEAEAIRHHHHELLTRGAPYAVGGCAFLDSRGGCRIYADRPYVCRTQGLPLRWLEERDGQVVELRDICPRNEVVEEGTLPEGRLAPLEALAADTCFTLGPFEERLARLELENRTKARVAERPRASLRGLFANECAPLLPRSA